MKKITLFNQEFLYKDYDCKKEEDVNYNDRPPMFTLYIQITNNCNAKCSFCNKHLEYNKEETFDFDKLEEVIKELNRLRLIRRIAFTGGEPLLYPDRMKQILDMIEQINPYLYVTLNTNLYKNSLSTLKELYNHSLITEVHISKHHWNNEFNDNLFNLKTLSLEDLRNEFQDLSKFKLNLVLQKDLIDTIDKFKEYVEYVSEVGFQEIRAISLLPLNDFCEENKTNTTDFISYFKETALNDGLLIDKDICCCLRFLYITNQSKVVNIILRNNFKSECGYCRQLVFDTHYLKQGFNSKIIY